MWPASGASLSRLLVGVALLLLWLASTAVAGIGYQLWIRHQEQHRILDQFMRDAATAINRLVEDRR